MLPVQLKGIPPLFRLMVSVPSFAMLTVARSTSRADKDVKVVLLSGVTAKLFHSTLMPFSLKVTTKPEKPPPSPTAPLV